MVSTARGAGTQYLYTERDAEGNYLDGGKTYKITLPGPVPVKQFWSFMVYDGSYTVWFGPEAPKGKESKRSVPMRVSTSSGDNNAAGTSALYLGT